MKETNNQERTILDNNLKDTISKGVVFDAEKCKSNIGKGEKREPKTGEIILDTGDYEISGEGDPYKETIKAGVIDHHRIDNYFRIKGDKFEPKCATKIVVDYKDEILEMINDRNVENTSAHFDGDLDSIVSSYLTQGLIKNKELPIGALKLAEHVNKVDYGMHRERDIGKYFGSLAGIFSAIKGELGDIKDNELYKEIFSNSLMKGPNGRLNGEGVQKMNEINTKYEILLNQHMFEILNKIGVESSLDKEFDCEKDMARVEGKLSNELEEVIKKGKNSLIKELEEFNKDFEKVERKIVKITVPKTGEIIEVPMIISIEPNSSPLSFTNLSYHNITPETIVAVYAGPNRKGGDMYDIGIMTESASLIDLGGICVALNRAEKEKREQLSIEDPTRIKLESLPERLGMSGSEQVLTKDPTVLVAGGSLIAASNNSLLTPEDFYRVLNNLK